MLKHELLKALKNFDDDAQIVISFNAETLVPELKGLDSVAFSVAAVDDGWKPSNVADLQLGDLIMG